MTDIKTWVEYPPGSGNAICMASMCMFWEGPGNCRKGFVTLKGLDENEELVVLDTDGKYLYSESIEGDDETPRFFCENIKCGKNVNRSCSIKKVRLVCLNEGCSFWLRTCKCCFMDVNLVSSEDAGDLVCQMALPME